MFNDDDYTYESILERMLEKIPNTIDKREGSIIYDALAPAAAELAQIYITLKNTIDLVFVDTAVDEYLDRLCNQIGIYRKSATKAIKRGELYNEIGELMDIDLESRFTCGDSYWKATEKISQGIYKMESETVGLKANDYFGSLIPIEYINGLATATLSDLLIPGEDEENDDELRERYFETINNVSFSGNIADYKSKTKEIDGVGAVKVIPCWNGGGTVKLIILDSNYKEATETLINEVQEKICPNESENGEGLAPVRT